MQETFEIVLLVGAVNSDEGEGGMAHAMVAWERHCDDRTERCGEHGKSWVDYCAGSAGFFAWTLVETEQRAKSGLWGRAKDQIALDQAVGISLRPMQ